MTPLLVGLLMLTGGFFMLLAGLGVIRMPDVLLRMSATTKAATLGAGCMLAAAALYFDEMGVTTRALATIVFLVATAPVAAHTIGRAAYFARVPLWEGMTVDELRGRYDLRTHALKGDDKEPEPPAEPTWSSD
jgi:multicomponent Na+:H+ antiporter subunit G